MVSRRMVSWLSTMVTNPLAHFSNSLHSADSSPYTFMFHGIISQNKLLEPKSLSQGLFGETQTKT